MICLQSLSIVRRCGRDWKHRRGRSQEIPDIARVRVVECDVRFAPRVIGETALILLQTTFVTWIFA